MKGKKDPSMHCFPLWPVEDAEHSKLRRGERYTTEFFEPLCWYCELGKCTQRVTRQTLNQPSVVVHGTLTQ